MSKNRDFKGIWIPAKIWLSDELTLQEKVFLVEIDSLDNEDGCWANNQYFSDFFNISKTRVSLIIKSLVDKGYVFTQVDSARGNKRILSTSQTKVKEVIKESLRGSLRKVKEGHKGKLKHNNTENNTKNNTEIESLPSFLDRGKTAKAMAQSICFESKEQMLQEISKTEYAEYLIQASAKWRGMNEKGKDAFLDEFAGKNATIKEYGGLKETYQTGIKTHMMNSLKYYEPAKEQTASTYAYYYKIGNKEKKHNDRAMWERDKRNFGNGQGYKEISVLV